MNQSALISGLLDWVAFVALVTLHEFAHAWTANRCGDDTPRLQGRLTVDPLAHMDLIGTIILPLAIVVMTAMGGRPMMFGWGRPVQVNIANFRHRRFDDILVSGAGPAMNLLAAFLLLCLMKILQLSGAGAHNDALLNIARLSLFLCFFNLLPVPPLDGGHILRNLVGISDEAYLMISQYSFMFLFIIMSSAKVGFLIALVTDFFLCLMALPFGWQLF